MYTRNHGVWEQILTRNIETRDNKELQLNRSDLALLFAEPIDRQ